MIYSTFWGATTCDPTGIVLADDGSLWISGRVFLSGLAVTPDAFQSEFSEGAAGVDAFLSHIGLHPPASLYTTYMGGESRDEISAFQLVEDGRLALYGSTGSSEWPTTFGAYDTIFVCNNL
ncbi:MAG: hypothetical protein KDB65_10125 [Calditrichaeota bacterium]|nr:hypothetical protein [Calditrichota bacterium]